MCQMLADRVRKREWNTVVIKWLRNRIQRLQWNWKMIGEFYAKFTCILVTDFIFNQLLFDYKRTGYLCNTGLRKRVIDIGCLTLPATSLIWTYTCIILGYF